MLPMIFAHFPAGASVGQIAHYYQNYEQGKLRILCVFSDIPWKYVYTEVS